MPELLGRLQWRARPPTSRATLLDVDQVQGVCLHWPGTGEVLRGDAVPAALRGWQRHHMQVRGWRDIAYSFAVDQHGRIWVCRGVKARPAANGDETTNRAYLAIVCVVAQDEPVSPELVTSVRWLVRYVRKVYPHALRVVGHGEIRPGPTDCPGPAVRRLLRGGEFQPAS
jgi:N-acetylmuramoyl-L-alanine amidase